MKRPMFVTGITAITTLALLIFIESGAVAIPIVTAMVLFLCILYRKNIKRYVIIPTVCIVALLTVLSFFLYNKSNVSPLLPYHQTTQSISGKVVSVPKEVSAYLVFDIQADKIGNNNDNTKIHVVLGNFSDDTVSLYDYLVLSDSYITVPTNEYGEYDFTELSDNILLTAQCDSFEKLWTCDKTPYYYCLRFKETISQHITEYMSKDNGALLNGMLFGEKAELSYTTAQSFRNAGISHLLAVSGLHTSLWCGLLIALLSAIKVPPKARGVICLVFLVLLCIVSGFTPSVVRASLMASTAIIAPFFKRTSDSINSLGFAMLIILLHNPYALLSVSLQLSAAATMGVLVAGTFDSKIQNLSRKVPVNKLKNVTSSLLNSILISLMAGLFTLPVSAYYFGVFSLASPISNLLCVQLAFYGILAGVLSVALSFINLPFIKNFSLLCFKITEFILDIVKELAGFVSEFRYCTVPIHKEYLHAGILIAIVISATCYLIFKISKNKKIIRIPCVLSAVVIFVSVCFPLTVPKHRNAVTIAKCDMGIQLIIRSGLNYAYIENTTTEISDGTFDSMPKATCENLRYYVPTYLSKSSINNLSTISAQYNPEEIILPPAVREIALSNKADIPENAAIDTGGFFTLSDEITFEIVDTSSIKYAIIKGTDTVAFIHLYGDTDFSKYVSTDTCDIAVYNDKFPDVIPENAETVVICTNDYNPVKLKELSYQCDELLTTAKHGNIIINVG